VLAAVQAISMELSGPLSTQEPSRREAVMMRGCWPLAIVITLAALVGAWMFRYEAIGRYFHRNRFTGAECLRYEECWLNTWPAEPEKPVAP